MKRATLHFVIVYVATLVPQLIFLHHDKLHWKLLCALMTAIAEGLTVVGLRYLQRKDRKVSG